MIFRWAKDHFFTKSLEFDKLYHFVGGGWWFAILFIIGTPTLWCLLGSSFFSLLWEIKDGLKHNFISSESKEGFSWKDLLCGILGAVLFFIINLL